MKVAHLTTVDLALRYLLLPQLRAVAEEGVESIGISGGSTYVKDLRDVGTRHIMLRSSTRGSSLMADLRAALELWAVLRREKVDILHTHNPKPGLYGRILGRLAGVPIVVNTQHGLYAMPDDPWLKRAVVYTLEWIAGRFSDAELIQSAEDLALIQRARIAPRGKARLLGNGIDVERFDPHRMRRERWSARAELGLPADAVVVGIVGRLVAEKGYPEFVEAMSSLGPQFVPIALGHDDPDKSDALSAATLDHARSAGIRFLGMQNDIERYYAAMDVFVLPSHREGVPRAAMEAAAMALPIVATDIRGCREVVEDGTNGILVPVRDPSALAAAIARLGSDTSLRQAMGAAGYARARTRFDERDLVARVLDTYEELCAAKGLSWPVTTGPDVDDVSVELPEVMVR
jgi:glycosyltransferase involved in cell wall biosynthesis